MSRPESWVLAGARDSTGAIYNEASCGESAGKEIFSPVTLGSPD